MTSTAEAHLALLHALAARNYHFITPTPLTHARVVARRGEAKDLRDVLGWSLPFQREAIEAEIVSLLDAAGALESHGDRFKSRLRVSSLDDQLFLHSAYPTTQHDAVFFGPDTYRFASFLRAELPALGKRHCLVDIGAGSGAGGIVAASIARPDTLILNDINPKALLLASGNAGFAQVPSDVVLFENDSLEKLEGFPVDLVIANPPYIMDGLKRAYRDGGGMHGAEISLAWAKVAAAKLMRGGALALYTGSAIVGGEDRFKAALFETLTGFDIRYRELDPDVFGEELEREDYADVERIAVVGVVAVKR